tara:strand:+ start:668 stop:1300 length:633 start_codon:yes stop_codon:yes gene_type:complete
MSNELYNIITGISQALSKKHDGAQEEDGMMNFYDNKREPVKIGLNREKVDNININSRDGLMDGFGCQFHGNQLIIKYHGEVNMKDLHRNGPKRYEEEIEQTFNDIVKFIKKEYKKVTGKTLNLSSAGDATSLIQRMSNIRNWVQSSKRYNIGGLDANEVEDNEEVGSDWRTKNGVEGAIKKFLSLSSKQNPKNRFKKNPERPTPGEVDKG